MLVLILSILMLVTSCPAEAFNFSAIPVPSTFTLPRLEEAILLDNSMVSLAFDRPVAFRDLRLDDDPLPMSNDERKLFTVRLPEPIPYGRTARLRFTVEDMGSGNMSRISIPLMGINRNQAEVIMTEISVKGTDTSPDRIELHVISPGTTGSLTITDGGLDVASILYTLPDFPVNRGDTIVLHMSAPHRGEDVTRVGNRRIFNIDADRPCSFLSTSGAVVLYSHTNGKGKVLDAFLYRKSDASSSEGWGNERTRITAEEMEGRSEWTGPGFISDGNTSTRVFARYWPYADTDSSSDWYLTATRGSTFGYINDNNCYVRPEESERE